MTRPRSTAARWSLAAFLVLACVAGLAGGARAAGLEADQLLLIVNRNVPAGQKLAEFYQNARHVPEGRILALDLPDAEDMPLSRYERDVVPAIRAFLRDNELEEKVNCLVTFHGVPLRIAPRVLSEEEQGEVAELREQKAKTLAEVRERLAKAEAHAIELDPSFKPMPTKTPPPPLADELPQLIKRGEAVVGRLTTRAMAMTDRQKGAAEMDEVVKLTQYFAGPSGVLRTFGPSARASTNEQVKRKFAELFERIQKLSDEAAALQEKQADPVARRQLREIMAAGFGALDHLRVIEAHLGYLETKDSGAALDSELALLWWNLYPRERWQANPLHYRMRGAPLAVTHRTLMVCRLDAPQSGQVRDIILASLKVERDGLTGRIVLDGRGLNTAGKKEDAEVGSYPWYDKTIDDLARLIRMKTNLALVHDTSPGVLPANAVNDVALYCGWYSLRNYIPCCRFKMGAVAYHVASFELVSLRNENEKGWVRGLLNDGVAATMGPVAEPFLAAFPQADEFFPLLLTGKLTLAEVYWRTQPLVSWQMCLIGDPLYRPYQKDPPLAGKDVPQRLHPVLDDAEKAAKPADSTPSTPPGTI